MFWRDFSSRPLLVRLCEPKAHTGDLTPACRAPEKMLATIRFLYCRKRFLPGTPNPSAFRTTRPLQYACMGSPLRQGYTLRFVCSPLEFTFLPGLGRFACQGPQEVHSPAVVHFRLRSSEHRLPCWGAVPWQNRGGARRSKTKACDQRLFEKRYPPAPILQVCFFCRNKRAS